jgi:hypothetical protein
VAWRGLGFGVEREFELAGDFGPEFAEDIVAHVLEDAIAHARCNSSST